MADYETKQKRIRLLNCVAQGCGKSKFTCPKLVFYPVPEDDVNRQIWLNAVGRSDLIPEKSVSYELCSAHYEQHLLESIQIKEEQEPTIEILPFNDTNLNSTSEFSNPQMPTKPSCRIKFEPDEEMDITEFDPASIDNQTTHADTQTHSVVSVSSEHILEKLNMKLDNKEYQTKVNSQKNELKTTKFVYSEEMLVPKDTFSRRLCYLLHWKNKIKEKYKNKRNSTEFNIFALNLYISSRYLYKHVKDILMLPSVNDLKQLKTLHHVPPKISYQILNCLATKLKSLPKEAKYCSLVIDTINLKRHLYYNITRDEIIGLHNLNGNVTNIVASTVYYIMLRGLAFDWKQLVSYVFLANNSCFIDLDSWVNSIIEDLSTLGIKIFAVISSQEPHFIQYASNKSVTVEKPFFISRGQKIYYIFDAPHWLTSLRDDLFNNEFYFKNQKISWSHIQTLYAFKKQNLLNILPKITDAHVTPSRSERRVVKYAAQIFSQSVFSTFEILMGVNFVSKELKSTADFIKTINDLFDVLNSKKLKCDNEYQSAFTANDNQVKTIMNAQKMLQNLQAVSKSSNNESTKALFSFKSIQVTIHSLILLSSSLKELGINQILTNRLNRDPIKSIKRMLNVEDGQRSKVTPVKFANIFAKQFISNIMSNTKTDGNDQADIFELAERNNLVWGTHNLVGKEPMVSEITPVLLKEVCDYRFQLPTQQAFTYLTGYLLFKCSKKHKCFNFDEMHARCPPIKINEDINKAYSFSGRLKIPPVGFRNNVRKLEDIFMRKFSQVVVSKPANQMLGLFQNVFEPPCRCFPTQYLLVLFLRFRIYSVLMFIKINQRSASQEVKVNEIID